MQTRLMPSFRRLREIGAPGLPERAFGSSFPKASVPTIARPRRDRRSPAAAVAAFAGGHQSVTIIAHSESSLPRARALRRAIAVSGPLLAALALSACQSAGGATGPALSQVISLDQAQGSEQNIASLTAAVNAAPQNPEPYNVRGSAYARGGNNAAAIADFTRAVELDPNFHQAYANRALVHRAMNDNVQAVSDYNRALQIDPNYAAAYIGRGNIYRTAGRNREALADFQRAIDLNTTDPRAFHNRGLLYQIDGQHRQAIEDFSAAIAINANAPEPYSGRAVSYLALNNVQDARDDINRALQLDQNRAEFWVNQGIILEAAGGEDQRVRAAYSRAAQLDPNYAPAREGLRRIGATPSAV